MSGGGKAALSAPARGPLARLSRFAGIGQSVNPLSLLAFDAHGVVISDGAVSAVSRDAGALLGRGVRPGLEIDQLTAELGVGGAPLDRAIRSLVTDGAAFRMRVDILSDRSVEVLGMPVGARCLLSFRDIAGEMETVAREAVGAQAAVAEAGALREALEAAAVPVWVRESHGAVRWRNAAALAADGTDPSLSRRGRSLPLPDGGAVTIGLGDASTGDPADGTVRRFIETVCETFAHLRVGLAIFDRDRRLMLSNPALAEMFGVDSPWLGGRPSLRTVLDRLRESRQLPEQADYPKWRAALFTLFEPEGPGTYEDVWDLPDGRSIQAIARPHPLGGIAFVFEDVTEAMALQRWRSTAVEVRRATLDLLADGVVVFGADGRIRVANPAFLAQWGLAATDATALHVGSLAARCEPLCGDSGFWRDVRAAVAGGAGRIPWEARVELADDRVLKARVAPMPDGSTLVALADVTDTDRIATALRERAEALEAAEQMRDSLMEHLSHRLRTPLNAVAGFAEMLAEGRAGPMDAMQASFVAHIREASSQLVAGIESLSGLAVRHGASEDGDATPVAIGPAVMGAIGLLERRASQRRVQMQLDPSLNTTVTGDEIGRMREQIYLLVAEAVAAAAPGERLTFGASTEAGSVIFWCRGLHRDPAAAQDAGSILARPNAIRASTAADGGVTLALKLGRPSAAAGVRDQRPGGEG